MWPFKKRLKISTLDFIKRFNISRSSHIKINYWNIRLEDDHTFNLREGDRIIIDDIKKQQFFNLKVIDNALIIEHSRKFINDYWIVDFHKKSDKEIDIEIGRN